MFRSYPLLCLLLTGTSLAAQAQTQPIDTARWRDTGPKAGHGLAEYENVEGRRGYAYFPVSCIGYEEAIQYFASNPEVRPFPKMKTVPVARLRTVRLRGLHLENMGAAGYPGVLAARVVEGPVELFCLSGSPRVPLPLLMSPLPLAATVASLGLSGIESNQWFLRRNGRLVAVYRSDFREKMAEYVSDCFALKTQVEQGQKGFRYADMLQIVQLYNEFLTAQGPKP